MNKGLPAWVSWYRVHLASVTVTCRNQHDDLNLCHEILCFFFFLKILTMITLCTSSIMCDKYWACGVIDLDGGAGEASSSKYQRSMSMPPSPATPATPGTPTTPSPTAARKENVWRSVFHPGSNIATKGLGSDLFDKPQPNSPTVYDWYLFPKSHVNLSRLR